MAEDVLYLLLIGLDVEKYRMLQFEKHQVRLKVLSSTNEISKCHFVISHLDKTWSVKDIKSQNGINLNGRQLVPRTSYSLQEGDILQFGVPTYTNRPWKLDYKLFTSLEIVLEKNIAKALVMRQIKDKTKESDVAKLDASKTKEDVISKFMELMDLKLQCSICREYLIKATILNCSHIFCQLCIKQWMRIKEVCPNCRTPVTSLTEVPALDICIDKIAELNDGMKNERKSLLNERQIEQVLFDGSNPGLLDALKALLSAEDGVDIVAALRRATAETTAATRRGVEGIRRATAQTAIATRRGVAGIRRATAQTAIATRRGVAGIRRVARTTGAEVLMKSQELGRSALRKAAAHTKTSVQTGARVLKRAKAFAEFSTSAVYRRAAALTKAAARAGTDMINRSTILRKAAALTRAVALTGTKALRESAVLKKAAALAKAAVFNSSDMLTRSSVTRRAEALTRAVAVKKAVVISGATALEKAVKKRVQLMKAAAYRKAADVKRRAANLTSSAVARVAELQKTLARTRNIVSISTNASAHISRNARSVTTRREVAVALNDARYSWRIDNGCTRRSCFIAFSFTFGT